MKKRIMPQEITDVLSRTERDQIVADQKNFEAQTSCQLRVSVQVSSTTLANFLATKSLRVYQAAVRRFEELGMTHTMKRNGILIFISLNERKVIVLADTGIFPDILNAETLEHIANNIAAGIDKQIAHIAIRDAISELKRLLAVAFPHEVSNTNELEDAIDFSTN
jgi:uncharacterized membrane protein